MKHKLIKQYEIVRRLGSGGGGVVYYANDTRLLRPVVLKMLRDSGGTDMMRGTLLREARLASAIEHPNVCSIYEVGEFEGAAFIAMQYVPGRTLEELIRHEGPLSNELIVSISMQIADGLAEAHRVGIVHRDLKPANIIITDGGLVKILDFGLAKRQPAAETVETKGKRDSTSRFGTIAYMAPEQFVTGHSSEQSDIFAFGVILYQMASGRHPFALPGAQQAQLARSIQYSEPQPLREQRPEIPAELETIVAKAMAKNPNHRYASVAEMLDSLRTLVRSLPADSASSQDPGLVRFPAAPVEDKKIGFFSMLAERWLGGEKTDAASNSVAVLPFADLGGVAETPFYGVALADAVSTRLARVPSLVVRYSSQMPPAADPLESGRKLLVNFVLKGSFVRSEKAFDLTWQLLQVATNSVRAGGTISVKSLDLVAIQNEIADQVYASLRGSGYLQAVAGTAEKPSKTPQISEDYLEARALLSSFMMHSARREDLEAAQKKFTEVLERDPSYAPAHSGLGLVHLQYVHHGFGGLSHVMAAQKCFERALESDPGSMEANLFRVNILLSRGEKDSARHAVRHLLESSPNSFAVHIVAGMIMRLDGQYDLAMQQFNTALQLNPANATMVYNHRARIYHYQGQVEFAHQEIRKGLTLEPRHPLLRTTLGYLYYREGDLTNAVQVLDSVLQEDPTLRLAYPTLAMCLLALHQPEKAAALITEQTLSAAEADSEMAYRLATFFALANDLGEALPWLRKAIYLGNDNYPWFSKNPAWAKLQENEDFQNILKNLKKSFRQNTTRWKQLLATLPQREAEPE